MKTLTHLRVMAVLFIATTLSLTGCSSDDDSPVNNSNTSLLYNKWWYDTDNFVADIYFDENGDYHQKINMFGYEITGDGEWTWQDEDAGIIKLNNLSGTGQVVSSVWFKVSDLTAHTVSIKQSTDGTSYTDTVYFADTDTE